MFLAARFLIDKSAKAVSKESRMWGSACSSVLIHIYLDMYVYMYMYISISIYIYIHIHLSLSLFLYKGKGRLLKLSAR